MTIQHRGVGRSVLAFALCVVLAACNNSTSANKASGLEGPTVAKVVACASGDHPEPALQGNPGRRIWC